MMAMGAAVVAGGDGAAAAVDQPDASSFQITGIYCLSQELTVVQLVHDVTTVHFVSAIVHL